MLERSRARRKTNLLKRNLKYMAYQKEHKLDIGKVSKLVDFLSERDRQRKDILREHRDQYGYYSSCCLSKLVPVTEDSSPLRFFDSFR